VTVKAALSPIQILQTSDKAIYVFGISTFNPEGNLSTFSGIEDTSTGRNATLFKFNEKGVLQWSRTLGKANSGGNSLGIIESDSGVFLAVSVSESVGSPKNAFAGSAANAGVFHIAKDGSILWNTYFGDTSNAVKTYSIAKLNGGDLLLSGETNSGGMNSFPGTILKLNPSLPAYAPYVMRIKSDGTAVWVHLFGGPTGSNSRSADRVAVSRNNTITTYGYDSEPFYSSYSSVVQNHSGVTPRKEFVVTQFDENGTYLRHTFLLTMNGQSSPILPLPIETETTNEFIFSGVTTAEFQGMDSVRARNYQGSNDQFLVKLNSTLNPSFVTYLGSSGDDQGSVYKVFQDPKKDGFFAFSPFLYNPGYGNFTGMTGKPTLGLVRVDPTGKLKEFGFRAETDYHVPYNMSESCDGGMLLAYYLGTAIDSSSSDYAKFKLSKVRPTIPINHEYSSPFGTVIGP
jgi:hypothetical protein